MKVAVALARSLDEVGKLLAKHEAVVLERPSGGGCDVFVRDTHLVFVSPVLGHIYYLSRFPNCPLYPMRKSGEEIAELLRALD